MCGIAGLFHLSTAKPVDPQRVRVMTDTLVHRGPDGSGVWTAPGIGLGHRRLAIIDLVTGEQPMRSNDGALTVVFNGEIYNFRELRRELEATGAMFQTNSDTEVILHGWRLWGADCVTRFNGMFAFALYDETRRCLFLARDRLGVKPLFYTELADGCVLFASELKGLLAHPLVRRTPDISAVEDFMAYGYVPDDTAIVAGVRKLPAGHHLTLRLGESLPAPVQYWDVSFADRARGSQNALEDELVDLMRAAVRSRMVADVPLGAFLSGGVDSSAVVALMAEASSRAVTTCSIGFDQADHDETRYAGAVAERFATDHHSRTVAADDFSIIDRLVEAFDEPFADASALPTYRVCALARETVTVALSGDGADEAFAGYRRHAFFQGEARARALLPSSVRRPLFGGLGTLYPRLDWAPRPLRAKTTLQALGRTDGEAYADAVGVTSAATRRKLFSREFQSQLGGHRAEDRYVRVMDGAPARDPLDRAQYADLKIWLPGDILTKVDRTSMAVSLEAREPLLDYRLIEFAARLPVNMRVRRGVGKWLMKHALERYLPDDILYRRKMGFVTPISAWFRGALSEEARMIAQGSALAETGWFDMDGISRLVTTHQAGVADHGRTLWQLLILEKSLRRLFLVGR
jgi:asparagine synthase (glutamine-hydrolysing)